MPKEKYTMKYIHDRLLNNNLDEIEGIYNYYTFSKDSNGKFVNVAPDQKWQKVIVKGDEENEYDVLLFKEDKPDALTYKYAEIKKSNFTGYKHKVFSYSDIRHRSSDELEFVDENFSITKSNSNGVFKLVFEKIFPNSNSSPAVKDENEWKGNGTGFLLNCQGYIATNYHVVEDAKKIVVEAQLDGANTVDLEATIVASDKQNDLSIIKVSFGNEDQCKIPYAIESNLANVSEDIYTLGFPMALSGMGKEIKFTDGVISSKSGPNGNPVLYQISAPIQGGNSGGPCFNSANNIIGINSSKLVSTEIENVSYAIKVNYLLILANSFGVDVSNTSSKHLNRVNAIKEISNYVFLIKIK